jgi:RNA polymerase sigma-70 factor (sigma-E family)
MATSIVPLAGTEAADLRSATATGHRRVIGDAFSVAVADHHRELARFAFRLCGDPFLAEDVVAEAYARVWPRWRRGGIDNLVAYLMRTVAHEVYKGHRRRVRERDKEPPPEREAAEPFESHVDERDALWAALGRLPLQQRVVVVLRVVEDMSEEQTATMLGIPTGTVKSRLSRALVVLRSILEGDDG